MPVYAIRIGDSDLVKIGKASDPIKRLAQLQVGHAECLQLTHQWRGDEREEYRLHGQFAATRVRGEWFSVSAEMLDAVELPRIGNPSSRIYVQPGEECLAKLKYIFKDRGIKQRDAAQHLGVSEPCVSHWVNGRYLVPTIYILPLARLLCIPVEALLPPKRATP